MRLLGIRHGKAGRRESWNPTDVERHLTVDGWSQAQRIAELFSGVSFDTIFSSPYPRCIETVEPLGKYVDVDIKPDERLSESTSINALQSFLLSLDPESSYVACTHGNVIPAIVELLVGREVGALPDALPCAKGSIWDIRIEKGRARYLSYTDGDRYQERVFYHAR